MSISLDERAGFCLDGYEICYPPPLRHYSRRQNSCAYILNAITMGNEPGNSNMNTPLAFDRIGQPFGSRRSFIRQLGFTAALFSVPGLFAEELARKTPWVEEGPFYPPKLPLDTDNDLIIVNDSITPAVGQIAHVSGRLLDTRGYPIRNRRLSFGRPTTWECTWPTNHAGQLRWSFSGLRPLSNRFDW